MNRKLQKLYDKMWTKETEEIVAEKSESFSKFDLSDYTQLIYEDVESLEEKTGHGNTRLIPELINAGIKKGILKPEVVEKNGGWMLRSAVDDTQYLTHKGEKGFHPFRRYLEYLTSVKAGELPPNSPQYLR